VYLALAIALGRVGGFISRITKRGSGVMVTGRVILKLIPSAVETLSIGRSVVLVSGTNGKSTTTALIHRALSTSSATASNYTGANLFPGIATALAENRGAPFAALEVDEMVLPWAIQQTKPRVIVLLNLGRDQLDRLSEVRVVAAKWKAALVGLPASCTVLADADDPFVTWAARDWVNVVWFTSGVVGHIDASTCPECGLVLKWTPEGTSYSCECGFKKPNPEWILRDNILVGPNNQKVTVVSAIPGKAAISNAARGVIAASLLGVPLADSTDAISKISSVDGRFSTLKIGPTSFRLLLSKNPASWRETLATSATGPKAVLLVVNANTQDGKDTSWLWDVDFTSLHDRTVVVTGERRLDVSVRLTVNDVKHSVVDDELMAANVLGNCEADLIASYTAFHRLAKGVKR
jgi:lipid II isoglutaminyl synthase (glutamine-hydrolysing)